MADFTGSFWSVFISLVTIASIVVLIYFIWRLSTRKVGDETSAPETMGHVWDEDLEEYNNPLPKWWLNLFYITLFWGVFYLILYPGLGSFKGLLGWSQVSQYEQEVESAEKNYGPLFEQYSKTDIEALAKDAEAIKIGERLFSAYCTTCHGSDARGARGFPNLRDDDWLYGGEPEQIVASITAGRSGIMPPWNELLNEKQIRTTARYVEHLAGRDVQASVVSEGKESYDLYCVACHGAEGKGNQQLGAPNLADKIWLHGGSTKKIIETIAVGRNGVMPPHETFLGAAKIHLIAAYVYHFRTLDNAQ